MTNGTATGVAAMDIAIIGCGRWGSLITWYLDRTGHRVTLYGMADAPQMQRFLATRDNDLLTLPDTVKLTTDIRDVKAAQILIISIPSQNLSELMQELSPLQLKNKTVVLCMKGIEIATGRRLSEIAHDGLDESCAVAVWLGPGHVQEFYKGNPSCMVIDSENDQVKHMLVDAFSSDLIRFYYGQDLIGNEIGAAAKNVIGIAAGMLDGYGLGTLKGALMARGTYEVAKLIGAMGGNERSAYGLCHLGDYEATVFSPHSHNRAFGECFAKGESFEHLAEGYYTVRAMVDLGKKYNVDLPICSAVYRILYEGVDCKQALMELMTRSLRNEF